MSSLNLNTVKAFFKNPQNVKLIDDLLAKREKAQAVRKHVDGYIEPVLLKANLKDDQGNTITDHRHVFLCEDDEKVNAFFAACDSAHAENGYDMPEGFCPALTAEHEAIKAENAVMDAASQAMDAPFHNLNLKSRRKFFDLVIKAHKAA